MTDSPADRRFTPDRRAVTLGLGAALAAPGLVRAQQPWPQGRQIRIVVPFTPAGATDVLARIMADKLAGLPAYTHTVGQVFGPGVSLVFALKVLFLAVTRANAVWRVPLLDDGSVSKVSAFFSPGLVPLVLRLLAFPKYRSRARTSQAEPKSRSKTPSM